VAILHTPITDHPTIDPTMTRIIVEAGKGIPLS